MGRARLAGRRTKAMTLVRKTATTTATGMGRTTMRLAFRNSLPLRGSAPVTNRGPERPPTPAKHHAAANDPRTGGSTGNKRGRDLSASASDSTADAPAKPPAKRRPPTKSAGDVTMEGVLEPASTGDSYDSMIDSLRLQFHGKRKPTTRQVVIDRITSIRDQMKVEVKVILQQQSRRPTISSRSSRIRLVRKKRLLNLERVNLEGSGEQRERVKATMQNGRVTLALANK